MIKYILDTNIVIYVIKKRPIEVLQTFNNFSGHMAISSITLSELIYGAEKSSQSTQNLRAVEDFASRLEVLPYNEKAAYHYGEIRADLERAGKIIGPNDLHIAAHARSEGAILVTNNLKVFERVAGLRVENWLTQANENK